MPQLSSTFGISTFPAPALSSPLVPSATALEQDIDGASVVAGPVLGWDYQHLAVRWEPFVPALPRHIHRLLADGHRT
ncbi:MAG: hypothetical protein ACI8RE_002143 [Ilumatobacter sp.]|jgi:hypothetical protein